MTTHSARRFATYGVFALTALAFAIFFIFTPTCCDDFWFRHLAMDQYFATGKFGFPAGLIREEIQYHIQSDNSRLCNIVFCVLVYLPRWITAAATSALCAWLLLMLARLAGIGKADWQAAIWLCVMFAIGMPWVEQLFTLCFQLNYTWSMAGAAWIALRVLRERPLHPVAAFFVGLIFGAWHEGFSVSVLCALGVLVLFYGTRYRRPWILTLTGGMVLGIVWLTCCPAFLSRGSGGLSFLHVFFRPQVLLYNLLSVCFFIVWAVAIARRASRPRALAPLCIFILVCCIASCLISLYALFGARVGMCGSMFAIAGIIRLWPQWNSAAAHCATALAGAFLIAHLAVASAMTFRTRGEYAELYEQYRVSTDGRVFTHLTPDFRAPFLALGKPLFQNQESMICQGLTRDFVSKPLLPVPQVLANATSRSGEGVDGKPGLRVLDRRFFIPADSLDLPRDRWTDIAVQATFGSRPHLRMVRAIPFTSRADGRDYFYLSVNGRLPLERLAPITAIDW
ncbi:MAG: hypothetical protein K2L96_06145 [Muribaculaceae bacterium]|nr:hypothetical protein [Muribaculaceae bacterium]